MRIVVVRARNALVNSKPTHTGFRWNFEEKRYEVVMEVVNFQGKRTVLVFTDEELDALNRARAERDEHAKKEP